MSEKANNRAQQGSVQFRSSTALLPALVLSITAFAAFSGFTSGVRANGQSGASGLPSGYGAAHDPGARTTPANAGGPISSLNPEQLLYFRDGLSRFLQVDSVAGTAPGEPGLGLGPTYNSNSCASCHAQPATGGSSPKVNPQFQAANDFGATNSIPFFLNLNGPVLEARFPFLLNPNGTLSQNTDGGVHGLFTIAHRLDAPGCRMEQPNFEHMLSLGNLVFRIPTPIFGSGLIENIPESAVYANMAANAALKTSLGISGHPNINPNDGTTSRFGWKAQNKSVQVFGGEAYNVEMGVTNELFPEERAQPPASCLYNATPEDITNFPASNVTIPGDGIAILSDTVAFADFMRFLAPPERSLTGIPGNPSIQSIANGEALFSQVHCQLCHTVAMYTGRSSYAAGLSNQRVALFSDLLVHHMGTGLSDNISQGSAGPDEFRTAPLWGLGQRLFFLHDGRATPQNGGLLTAILAHSGPGSEANGVISAFQQLSPQQQQDLLNYLRSL